MKTDMDFAGAAVIALGQDELVIIRGGFGPWGIGFVTSLLGGAVLMVLDGWEDFKEGLAEGWEDGQEGG